MFRFVVLAIAVTIALVQGDDIKKCIKLHDGIVHCCKDLVVPDESANDNLKECFQIPPSIESCDHDICIGKKRGFASADGTVDMDAMEKMVTEDFKSNPALVDAIKDKCLKEDISKYGPPGLCHLAKLNTCIRMTMGQHCNTWDNGGACSGMKDLAAECIKMFSK